MAQSSQFSAAKVLEAAQQAEAGGNRDYAVQFYRHITEQHPQSPEAVSAQDGLARLLGPQLNAVGEQSGPVSATMSEQNDFTQPPKGRGPASQTSAGAPGSHNRTQPQTQPSAAQTQSSVATSAATSAQSHNLQPHTLQPQSAQTQSVQSNGSDAAAPRPQVQNGEAAAANSGSIGPASNGANRPGNASTINGAGNGAGNGASASPRSLSGNGGAANGAPATAAGPNNGASSGAVQFNGAAATSNGGARPQSVQNPALSYQPGPAPAHPEPEVQSHGQPAQFSLAQGNLAQGNLTQGNPGHSNPGQNNLAAITVPPGKDHYRIGRAVTYIFGFLGWLLLLASIGAAGAAIFAPGIIPGLAPRGGGLAGILPTLLSGAIAIFGSLVIISFAQLLRAVFDNANANRELVALRRAAAR